MSALDDLQLPTGDPDETTPAVAVTPSLPATVEVRRSAGVSAVLGAAASALAIAWFSRAISSGALVDWLLVLLLGVLGVAWLASFLDSRTPLLVADDQGARIRLGRAWLGLPWSAVSEIRHQPRANLFRDGRVELVAHNPERLLAGLSPSGARQARMAAVVNGGPLALPLGWGTTVSGARVDDLGETLQALADASQGVDVLVRDAGFVPQTSAEATASTASTESTESAAPEAITVEQADGAVDNGAVDDEFGEVVDAPRARPEPGARRADVERAAPVRPLSVGLQRLRAAAQVRAERRAASRAASRAEIERLKAIEEEALREAEKNAAVARAAELAATEAAAAVREGLAPSPTPTASRAVPSAARAEVVRPRIDQHADQGAGPGDGLLAETGEGDESEIVSVVEPVVIDESPAEPVVEPVVGPELKSARQRLALSVDSLAERTRIRPHVIEAIEVDDFAPCGGDFYARGHLRTLARVLGIDPEPLLVRYDERYAKAPITARKVFEAELSTTAGSAIRGTRGGPNLSVLVAAVMGVVLLWSVAQLVLDRPAEESPSPILNGSGGPQGGVPAGDPVKVVVEAQESGAEIVVRDAAGQIVFNGPLAIGEKTEVEARAPVRVQSSDGSATVSIDGRDRGPVGKPGDPAQGTYAGE